ncbi:MAG: amidohydrolase family protein [Deltaproteobacteria bacterium]|nr:amidohydrolase family protein [Deltaproteobacteria bacterium]
MRTIAIEEHFLSTACKPIVEEGVREQPFFYRSVSSKLADLGDDRLKEMDEWGIDVQVLMHTMFPDTHPEAVRLAQKTNDELAAAIAAHPDRYAGFAILPWGHPEAAVEEIKRAVRSLGFNGVMCNGRANGLFLDDPSFFPVWKQAAELNVPVYIHPAYPPKPVADAYFTGFDPDVNLLLATTCWGWHSEVGLHALRLIVSGLFDRLPALQVIIGHMGEMFPFMLDRIEHWMTPVAKNLKRKATEYFRENFYISTSGFFSEPPLVLALETIGADRIIFAVDYPYNSNRDGREFLDGLRIGMSEKAKITHLNAERLLGIKKGQPSISVR